MEFKDYEAYNIVPRKYLGTIARRILGFMNDNNIKHFSNLEGLVGAMKIFKKEGEDIDINQGDCYAGRTAISIRYRVGGDRVPLKVVFNEDEPATKISIKGAYVLPQYETTQLTHTDWIFHKEWEGLEIDKLKKELRILEKLVRE